MAFCSAPSIPVSVQTRAESRPWSVQAGRQAGGLREALKVEGWREDGGVNEERRERREGGEEVELLNERWKRHAKGTCEARASALI